MYNRPRKQRPNAQISYSEASDAPLEFSMLGDATQVQYDDEGDENELEEMMEQNPAASLTPVNMIMVRGAKHRKFGLKNKISINSVNFFFHIWENFLLL